MTLLIPRSGYRVRDPLRGDYLPAAGRDVDLGGEHLQYWARALSCGDVVEQSPAIQEPKPTARSRKNPASANASEDQP